MGEDNFAEALDLATVNKAINAIMITGQSYKIGSRMLTRANLTELRKLRDQLMREEAAKNADASLIDGAYVSYLEPR